MSKLVIIAVVIIIVILGVSYYRSKTGPLSTLPDASNTTEITDTQKPERITTVATGLEIPWAVEFLPASRPTSTQRGEQGGPNKDILFTERTGKLKLISNGQVSVVAQIPDVKVYGEGGLMGLTLHPDFNNNHYLYLMLTYSGNGNDTLNRVVRYKYENGNLSDRKIIVDKIPGAIYHNGGRIKFGPDKLLYITTGDSLEPSLAQNTNSLAGKILRVTEDGSPAPDNPFNNLVYSYGHRNPQGLAWDNQGRLWETEHGRSSPSGYDEVNLIEKGKNYGWPTIQGGETRSGMQSPVIQSGDETWAPAGVVFYSGSLYFGGLKGQALYEIKIKNGNANIIKHLLNEYGRIRDVTLDSSNNLIITTSNRDGRGDPKPEDDRIFQIDPNQL